MFSSILGNEDLKDNLIRLKVSGRVPNAMLFAGPEGVGKRLFALELARLLLCSTLEGNEACEGCSTCTRVGTFEIPDPTDKNREDFRKVFFGRHGDVGMVVAHRRVIAVDAIRELEKEVYFRPFESSARIFIIDDADKMNDAASNALLKTLEEPAAASHIILVTSRPDSLVPTIRSRSQTFRFAPVATEQITKFLMETRGLAEPDARLGAKLSGGSVGRAMTLDIESLKGRRSELVEVLRNGLVEQDRVALLRAAEQLSEARNKDNFEDDLELLLTLIRDVWAVKLGETELGLLHADLFHELNEAARHAEAAKLESLIGEIGLIRERLVVNLNKKLAADDLFMKIAA
jgi:DNA polymerase III subunit delta'